MRESKTGNELAPLSRNIAPTPVKTREEGILGVRLLMD
jgi:hypothetical protein